MRDRTKLHPYLQYKIELFLKECEKSGLEVGIGECVRTVQEQNALYAKGRTDKSSGIVTNCKGDSYSSPHQWGIAFDFYRNDGKGAYNEADRFFPRAGELAKSVGLEWGGDWRTFRDQPHIQLPCYGSAVSARLKKLYGTPNNYFKTWDYIPTKKITKGSSKKDVAWLQERLRLVTGIPIDIDGCFGSQTSNAIRSYWESKGWTIAKKVNGFYRAGYKTIEALSQYK